MSTAAMVNAESVVPHATDTAKRTRFISSELRAALWAFRREFMQVGLLSFLTNLLMLAPTIYMLQLFDRVLASRSELTLLAISLITLFLFALLALFDWLRSRVLVGAGMRLDLQLGTRVFNASFQSRLGTSETGSSRAFADLMQMRQFITGPGIFALFDAPWTPIYIAVIFILHPLLGVLSLVFGLVQLALAWYSHHRTVSPAEDAGTAAHEVAAYVQNKLRNAEMLEAMGMVANLQSRWNLRHQNAMSKNSHAQRITHRLAAWSKFIRYSQLSLALGAGALLVIDGQLTAGSMIAANLLMARALAPIDQLVSSWRGVALCRAAFRRLEELLARYPARDAASGQTAPSGQISVNNLAATVPAREVPILKNISFSAPAGTVVAIIGPSGSGKTTLARCLLGIWPDTSGEVLLDGLPITNLDRNELGASIGYLPQEIELFDGTIAENIARLGEVDSQAVIAASQSAGMHELILHLPQGYNTPIGEAGTRLSGGQRQRLALARALYGQPAIVVLDEPNANLDDAGEAALLRALRELKARGATVFLITQRQGAIAVADRIMVLDDGAIRADGPRDEVLANLWRSRPGTVPAFPQPA